MLSKEFNFTAKAWEYNGAAAWFFANVPADVSLEISSNYPFKTRGFGSVPVKVTIQNQNWNTSLFPDKKSGCYLLPLKRTVRKELGIEAGSLLDVKIEIEF